MYTISWETFWFGFDVNDPLTTTITDDFYIFVPSNDFDFDFLNSKLFHQLLKSGVTSLIITNFVRRSSLN